MARLNREHLNLFMDQGLNMETRTIYFGYGREDGDCDLDEVLAARVLKSLHLLHAVSREAPIAILFNNTGGEDTHGLGIYDMIRSLPCEVHGYIWGNCQSMAVWVLQACDRRLMSKHSTLMIHHGEGTKDYWSKHLDEICAKILLDRIHEKHPAYSRAKLEKLLDVDTYLTAQQALELGLIDEVIE